MITESATVLEIGTQGVLVEVYGAKGCGSCAQKSGCGTGLLERWLNPRREIWISCDGATIAQLQIGAEVRLAVEEKRFVRNALVLYLLPLCFFLLGAGLGFSQGGEYASILGGIIGLIVGGVIAKWTLEKSEFACNFSPTLEIPKG